MSRSKIRFPHNLKIIRAPEGCAYLRVRHDRRTEGFCMFKSKDEPRDGSWARHKIAAELRWVRNNGGALDEKGGFNPHTWKALFKAKALGVAIGKSKDSSAGAVDGTAATYLVVESSMNWNSMHAKIGLNLVAVRARIKLRSASTAVGRVHRLGLWHKQERHGNDGEWTSNSYDFSEAKNVDVLGEQLTTVLHALKLVTKSCTFDRTVERKNGEILKETFKSRSPARMSVFVWVSDQIVLKRACACFTLNELVKGTGLKRRAAKVAINGLLADGTFIKVGEGAISLREAVGRPNSIVRRVDGALWTEATLNRDRPATGKRSSKSVLETAEVRVRETADGNLLENAYGALESVHGAPQSADGGALESAYGVLQTAQGAPESADILLAESYLAEKSPEGIIPPAASSCSATLDDDSELLVSALPVDPGQSSSSSLGAARPSPSQEAIAMITRAMEAPGAGLEAQDELIAQVWLAIEHAHGGNLRATSPGERLHTFAKERRYGGMSDETVQGWRVLRERLTPADVARIVARVNEAIGADPPWPDTAVLPMIGPKIVRAQKMGRDFDWVLRSFKDPGNWPIQSRPPFSVADFGRMATTALKAAEAALAVGNRGAADVNRDA